MIVVVRAEHIAMLLKLLVVDYLLQVFTHLRISRPFFHLSTILADSIENIGWLIGKVESCIIALALYNVADYAAAKIVAINLFQFLFGADVLFVGFKWEVVFIFSHWDSVHLLVYRIVLFSSQLGEILIFYPIDEIHIVLPDECFNYFQCFIGHSMRFELRHTICHSAPRINLRCSTSCHFGISMHDACYYLSVHILLYLKLKWDDFGSESVTTIEILLERLHCVAVDKSLNRFVNAVVVCFQSLKEIIVCLNQAIFALNKLLVNRRFVGVVSWVHNSNHILKR